MKKAPSGPQKLLIIHIDADISFVLRFWEFQEPFYKKVLGRRKPFLKNKKRPLVSGREDAVPPDFVFSICRKRRTLWNITVPTGEHYLLNQKFNASRSRLTGDLHPSAAGDFTPTVPSLTRLGDYSSRSQPLVIGLGLIHPGLSALTAER